MQVKEEIEMKNTPLEGLPGVIASPAPTDTVKKLNSDPTIFDVEAPDIKNKDKKLSEYDRALMKDAEPFFLTDFFIMKPCVSIMSGFMLLLIITVLA